ncbi:hypothetical protein Tco_1514753 [Tanacetum coccineum]
MRRRRTKMLDTISEDEREFTMNESSSLAYSAPLSHQATSSSANSVHYFKKAAQRKFPFDVCDHEAFLCNVNINCGISSFLLIKKVKASSWFPYGRVLVETSVETKSMPFLNA